MSFSTYLRSVVFLVSFFCSFCLFAQTKDVCKLGSVSKFSVDDNQISYDVAYQVLEGSDKNLPTLIFLQGGPGAPIIREDTTPVREYSEVRMDLPGTGCSTLTGVKINEISLSTEAFVELWVQLIHKLQLKNVSILGLSYGTQLATQLAHRLETETNVHVDSVIMQGTTGPASQYPQWAAYYFPAWEKQKALHPNAFSEQNLSGPMPLGFNPTQWRDFLLFALSAGHVPQAKGPLLHYLDWMDTLVNPQATDAAKQKIRDTVAYVSKVLTLPHDQEFLYQKLSCEESNPSGMEYNLIWENGSLRYPEQGFCTGSPWSLTRPYNPKNFSFQAPTFYFEGEDDPNTPTGGALYHVQANAQNPRTFAFVHGGAHGSLSMSLFDCSVFLTTQILKNRDLQQSDFQSCANKSVELYKFQPYAGFESIPLLQQIFEDYLKKVEPVYMPINENNQETN